MAFRSSSGAAKYPSNSLTITAPASITDGDILVACVWAWGGTPPEGTFSLPSGFTAWYSVSFGSYKGVLAWKRASSESGNYAFSITSAEFVFGQMVAFSGRIASGDPLDVGSNTAYTTSNTTVRAAGVTIATSGSDLIYVGFGETNASAALTAPSGMTSRRSDDWTGDWTAMETASLDNQSTGATGDKDGTANTSTATKHAFLVALKPAAGEGIPLPLLNHLLLGD
jgi:hypothetical protein